MKNKIPRFKKRFWKTKDGKIKYCYYHAGPRPERKETPLGSDYKTALKKWAEIEGVNYTPAKSGTVADVYRQYIKWAEQPKLSKLSPVTVKGYKEYWGQPKPGEKDPGRLHAAFGKHSINSVQSSWAFRYFESRSSQIRAKKELKFLQTLCNWARSRGLMTAPNPLEGILRQMKVNEKREIYVEDSWYDLTHKHGNQLVKDVMEFAYLGANRPAETTAARFKDIEGDELIVRLMKTEESGLKEKRIPIAGQLAEYIDRQRRKQPRSFYLVSDEKGQKITTNGSKFRRAWKRARDSAEAEAETLGINYERFQLKDLRSKAGTDIARDFGIEAARLMLGHTTQKQTNDYIRSLRGAASKAFNQ